MELAEAGQAVTVEAAGDLNDFIVYKLLVSMDQFGFEFEMPIMAAVPPCSLHLNR